MSKTPTPPTPSAASLERFLDTMFPSDPLPLRTVQSNSVTTLTNDECAQRLERVESEARYLRTQIELLNSRVAALYGDLEQEVDRRMDVVDVANNLLQENTKLRALVRQREVQLEYSHGLLTDLATQSAMAVTRSDAALVRIGTILEPASRVTPRSKNRR